MTAEERIKKALEIAEDGQTDGAHHKLWVIDQMVRALTDCPIVKKTAKDSTGQSYTFDAFGESKAYKRFVAQFEEWDEGIPP